MVDIVIGSNTLRNTNGVFLAHGEELLRVEFEVAERQIILTMGFFMPTGTLVGKLERNTWLSNEGDRFQLILGEGSLKILDSTLKTVVIELSVKATNGADAGNCITIPLAKFYTSKGVLSEVTADSWRVGNKMELTGIEMDLQGGGIVMPD